MERNKLVRSIGVPKVGLENAILNYVVQEAFLRSRL